jgi:hypothetical protein
MGQLVFQATAGGQVALVGPNPSASFSLNVPAVSGTLVTTGDTGTVTNTMLASNVYTAPGTIGSVTPNTGAFTNLAYTGTLTGGTGIVNLGSGQFYKDASGNVGIGTSAPNNKLEVDSGNVGINLQGNAAPTFLAINNTTNSAGGWGAFSTYPGHILVSCATNSVNATGGNGIEFQESVYGAGYGHLISGINVAGAGTALTISGRQNAATWTEFARFDTSGNLLVGTTTNNGVGMSLHGGANPYGYLNSSATSNTAMFFAYNGTTVGTISQNTTTTFYNTTSDERLKDKIGFATSTDVIDNTVIYDYSWKANGLLDRGVFAQEAKLVKPIAVFEGTDELGKNGSPTNPWQVDYSKYIPDLIVYCQQLKKSLEELNAKVDAQAAEIQALKGVA